MLSSSHRDTLRFRLLWPLLLVSMGSAALVASLSFWVGSNWALHDVQERYSAIELTLRSASFPLTDSVIASLSKLSGTDLIALDDAEQVLSDTLDIGLDIDPTLSSASLVSQNSPNAILPFNLKLGAKEYLAFGFSRHVEPGQADRATRVVVLFDASRVRAAGRRAALLPLVTGLSTIVLLTTLMTWMTGRLANRLAKLESGVQRVADGDFNSPVADMGHDEVGRLGQAVNKMASQLQHLWQQVNRQQSEKLLHQLAGGMAHQLRNTLTGARLALELHQQACPQADQAEVTVALREMEGAEDYVRRLLLVGAGQQQIDEPADVLACLVNVRASQAAIAKHLRVNIDWNCDLKLERHTVADGATFRAAVANLVLNALQAASQVTVQAELTDGAICRVIVSDNGPGIPQAIAEQIFEPFVTSKPEGMGLGLPLVRRAADKLGGQVKWARVEYRTCFEFQCKVTPCQT